MQAILEHLQLISADVRDLRREVIVRYSELSTKIDRVNENLSKRIDRNSEKIDRLEGKVDRNHRALLEGAKERHERIARLEEVVCA